jgi:hypothetical protein
MGDASPSATLLKPLPAGSLAVNRWDDVARRGAVTREQIASGLRSQPSFLCK